MYNNIEEKGAKMVQNSILISCIMPIYDSAIYLENTISSIVQQSFPYFELILVDDASKDESFMICKKWQEKDERIIVLQNIQNKGAALSRNLGFQHAKGKYVIFLDSDDIFYPDMFLTCYQEAESKNADLVVFGSRLKVVQKEMGIHTESIIDHKKNYQEIFYEETNLETLLTVGNEPWNKFVKKELIDENHITFQDIPNANDLYYAMVTTLCAQKIVILDKIFLEKDFCRENSLTSSRNNKKNYFITAFAKVYWYIAKYCENRKISDLQYLEYIVFRLIHYFYDPKYLDKVKQNTLQQIYDTQEILEMFDRNRHNLQLRETTRSFINAILEKKNVINKQPYTYCLDIVGEMKKNGKKIVLWGCGIRGKQFLDTMDLVNLKIDHVVDKNKHNMYYKSYLIEDYQNIKHDVDVILILNSKYYDEIAQEADGKKLILLDLNDFSKKNL